VQNVSCIGHGVCLLLPLLLLLLFLFGVNEDGFWGALDVRNMSDAVLVCAIAAGGVLGLCKLSQKKYILVDCAGVKFVCNVISV
jgi:hypothetical protein